MRARARLAGLAAAVLAAHVAVVGWMAHRLQPMSELKKMADPMFTRVLQPQAPAPVAMAAAPPTPSRARPAIVAPRPVRRASEPRPAQQRHEQPPRHGETDRKEAVATAQPAASAPAPSSDVAPHETDAGLGDPGAFPTEGTSSASASPPGSAASASVAQAPASAASAATPAASSVRADLDSWPADTRLNYRLTGNFRGDLYGDARVQWQRLADRYQVRVDLDIAIFAKLAFTSQGDVTPQGLAPRAYEELRRSGSRIVRFTDDALVLANGQRVPRPAAVQDTASQFVELSHRFATGRERLEAGRTVDVWLARPGGVDLWTYDIVGKETLSTPQLGPVEAYHLKPRMIPNPRGNITAEIWFAPTLQYLPVRIRVTMGTEAYVDLVVETIQQR